eukprot:17362-Heterococcus_DN1.PRE.2
MSFRLVTSSVAGAVFIVTKRKLTSLCAANRVCRRAAVVVLNRIVVRNAQQHAFINKGSLKQRKLSTVTL